MDENLIYLDHAATTFPRQPRVMERMLARFQKMGCSPGRGGYDLAVETEIFVQGVRRRLASFFGAAEPERVVFTANASEALNLAILGLTSPGGHVVSTRLEHNSVLRPLYHLERHQGVALTLVGFDAQGFVDPDHIAGAIRDNTQLVVVNHASNVLGTVQPVAEIGRVCAGRSVPLLIDTAQSAGSVLIDMGAWNVSAIAFTGHKALLGPTGIGGLITAPGLDIAPSRFGGTGYDSSNPAQPETYPQRLEVGTLNVLGVMGLNAGLDYLEEIGLAKNHGRKIDLLARLRQGLAALQGVTVYGGFFSKDRQVPVLCCNLAGLHPGDAGMILDGDHAIAVRTGLHCAPLLHADIGSAPFGAVRFSLGWNTSQEDIDRTLAAVRTMTEHHS